MTDQKQPVTPEDYNNQMRAVYFQTPDGEMRPQEKVSGGAFVEYTLPDGSRVNRHLQHPDPRRAMEMLLNEISHWTGKPHALPGELSMSVDRLGYKKNNGGKKNYVDQSTLPPLEPRFEIAKMKIAITSTNKKYMWIERADGKSAPCWGQVLDQSGIGSALMNSQGVVWAQLQKGDVLEAAPINQRSNGILVAYTSTDAGGKQSITKIAIEPPQGGGVFNANAPTF